MTAEEIHEALQEIEALKLAQEEVSTGIKSVLIGPTSDHVPVPIIAAWNSSLESLTELRKTKAALQSLTPSA